MYERENLTPQEFAVRVRQIPGLQITAPSKMAQAVQCHVSFADAHIQTRKFHERDEGWLEANWNAGDALLKRIAATGVEAVKVRAATVFNRVAFTEIIHFLGDYRAHEAHEQFSSTRLRDYIAQQNSREPGSLAEWNVAVIATRDGAETERPLGSLGRVRTVNRAKLALGTDADIKALMSREDATVDMPEVELPSGAGWPQIKEARSEKFKPGRALLLLYPIDRDSRPQRPGTARAPLAAVHDVLGVGIVFPHPKKPVPLGYVRAAIDLSRFEQAEYEEETLPDDENMA